MPRRKCTKQEFYNEKLGCKFSLPEPFCLRHVEEYETARDQAREAGGQFAPSINWIGAMAVVEDWECASLPNPKELSPEDFADVHGVALQVVLWVGSQVVVHVMEKLFVPKN